MTPERNEAWIDWHFAGLPPALRDEFLDLVRKLNNFILEHWGRQLNQLDDDAEALEIAAPAARHGLTVALQAGLVVPQEQRRYALTAGKNKVRDHFRKHCNQLLCGHAVQGDSDPADERDGSDPVAAAVHHEEQATLEAALEKLSAEQREVLRLRHVEGHTLAEIARQLGLPYALVRERYHTARSVLADVIRRQEPGS